MLLQLRAALLGLALLLSASPLFAAADHSAEQARILSLMNSHEYSDRIAACRSTLFSGITSEEFFDVVASKLSAQFLEASLSRANEDIQEMSWYAKALASSGNPKYRRLLNQLAEEGRDLGSGYSHLVRAVASLPKFQQWNAAINDESAHEKGQDWELTSTMNMLRAEDPTLATEGIKRIKKMGVKYPQLYDEVERLLLAEYKATANSRACSAQAQPSCKPQTATDIRRRENVLARFCSALAQSQDSKYRKTLGEVATRADSIKVRKHARKAYRILKFSEEKDQDLALE